MASQVSEADKQPLVEEAHSPQPLADGLRPEGDVFKNCRIWEEPDGRAGCSRLRNVDCAVLSVRVGRLRLGRLRLGYLRSGIMRLSAQRLGHFSPVGESYLELFVVAMYFHIHSSRQGIDGRNSYAVQPS